MTLYAYAIRFRGHPRAAIQKWTRFYEDDWRALAGAQRILYRQFGLNYVLLSVERAVKDPRDAHAKKGA